MSEAKKVLQSQLALSESVERAIVEKVSNVVIKDRLAPAAKMKFGYDKALTLTYGDEEESYSIHHHALGQMAAKAGIPMAYVNQLNGGKDWMVELLAHNLNELFHKPDFKDKSGISTKFLHRIVGKELRGFLSRKYNRHLASSHMLQAFVGAYKRCGAGATDSVATPVQFGLRAFLPVVFEPVPKVFVAFGVRWSNSDFGAGKMSVTSVMKMIGRKSDIILSDAVSKVHLGSVIQESDLEMSKETMAAEAKTVAMAINDAVTAQLSEQTIDRLLSLVAKAEEETIPWYKLRNLVSKFLYKDELASVEAIMKGEEEVEDLDPVEEPTRLWASSVVSLIASRINDPTRKQEIEQEAGNLLGVPNA